MSSQPPSSLDEMLRRVIAEVVREVLRAELAAGVHAVRNGNASTESYLSIARAAHVAAVAPGTVRTWIRNGRLPSKRAGRRGDLEAFMSGESRAAQARTSQRADAVEARGMRALRRAA